MFRGLSLHTLDPKGRIIIPARFRDIIKVDGSGVMLTLMDGAVWVYTYTEWQNVESKVLAREKTSEYLRRFRRFFIGSAADCKCDKQGRILIPQSLRSAAELDREIMLVGNLTHFEIWDKNKYEAEGQRFFAEDVNKEEVRNEIAELGL